MLKLKEEPFLTRTIDEFTKIKQLPGLTVVLDFEKAFDSLSWNFLLKTLKSFNFGESFTKWVSILYTNISIMDLLEYRNTPISVLEYSPAQWLMRQKTLLSRKLVKEVQKFRP